MYNKILIQETSRAHHCSIYLHTVCFRALSLPVLHRTLPFFARYYRTFASIRVVRRGTTPLDWVPARPARATIQNYSRFMCPEITDNKISNLSAGRTMRCVCNRQIFVAFRMQIKHELCGRKVLGLLAYCFVCCGIEVLMLGVWSSYFIGGWVMGFFAEWVLGNRSFARIRIGICTKNIVLVIIINRK